MEIPRPKRPTVLEQKRDVSLQGFARKNNWTSQLKSLNLERGWWVGLSSGTHSGSLFWQDTVSDDLREAGPRTQTQASPWETTL